ncbi:MAG: hypothetical protein VKI83_01025 [Synechococcaceae cyanobacterium]|nr:hypothetical protein [Synechococcaceae cyanobacterium]
MDPALLAGLTHDLWIEDRAAHAYSLYRLHESQLCGERRPLRNLGNLLRDLNRFEDADLAYAMAMLATVRSGPSEEYVGSAWNRSQILIGLERYPQAYTLAEQRLQRGDWHPWRPPPFWQGFADLAQGLQGDARFLTLWSEQGLGDTLQYLRWLPLLRRRCPGLPLKLEVEANLVPLLKRGLAWLDAGLTIAPKGCDPRPDPHLCHGSLLSLPWLLGGAPAVEFCPYLRDPLWHWAQRAPRNRPPRVGLVWASGRKLDDPFMEREYIRRSLPPAPLQRLLQGLHHAGAELVMLQHGDDRERPGAATALFSERLPASAGFAETADRLAQLDLVISVDTAMAHLLGALGAPGWILLPWAADPRWLRDREDSPWYPSLTLLRQPSQRDWQGLVDRVLKRFGRWRQRSGR